jgi:hypothetical protein
MRSLATAITLRPLSQSDASYSACEAGMLGFRDTHIRGGYLSPSTAHARMQITWIDLLVLAAILWLAFRQTRVKNLEAQVRWLEIQCNTHEMNIKKLYFFRDIEAHALKDDLTAEERRALQSDLDDKLRELSDRNKALMKQTTNE